MPIRIRRFCLVLLLACFVRSGSVRAQVECADGPTITPVSRPNQIEWDKFPGFTLPFTLIYGGPRLGDAQGRPLQHGFSHIVRVADGEYGTYVPFRQRAIEWSGFAYGLNQPWETLLSPWNNDLAAYRARWDKFLSDIAGGQKNAGGQYVFPANWLMVDIERMLPTDARILRLKTDPGVPAQYRQLGDADFVTAYKRAMRSLYADGLRYVRQRTDLAGAGATLGTYSDTPILNTYLNVPGNTWADWTTNPGRVNYLVKDSTEQRVGGPFYDQLDALSPSAYYYYDYPNPLARDYLAYLLFQVEANRAWSNKPVVPFVWLRYHNSTPFYPNFIQPFMAEATAIFPFFSGASGLWLWDEPGLDQSRQDVYTAYERFIGGLYRLSRFADMFTGDHELVIETTARDLMNKQLPVWRGVAKGNQILVAAQNPYATDGQTTTLTVRYKNWQQTITLTGRGVYLCRHDMGTVTATAPGLADVAVFPNPAATNLTVSLGQRPATPTELTLLNTRGQVVVNQATNQTIETLNVANLPAGLYVLRITNATSSQTKKVLITR